MKELILGGVRSGKSRLAEQRAHESGRPVLYVAVSYTHLTLPTSDLV
jgi:adenosylcobinamide kinase/adenosylcobinamide-phosphate guanylyltransferase